MRRLWLNTRKGHTQGEEETDEESPDAATGNNKEIHD
jgi:hypothetical protein